MPDHIKRRDFIRNISLAGASVAIAEPVVTSFVGVTSANEISNDHFKISFDRQNGIIHVFHSNGSAFLSGGIARINFKADQPRATGEKYRHSTRSGSFSDNLGTGKKLVVTSRDQERKADLELHLSLYDHLKAFTVEAFCKNVSRADITIHSIEPLRVLEKEQGVLSVPGVSKAITNGEMYFDTGIIHEFGKKENGISSGDIKGVRLANGPIASQAETIHSWWNAGLFSGYEHEGVSIGYLSNDVCLGNVLISKTVTDQISFIIESVYAPELVLKPGKTISSNRVMINIAADPYTVLEDYAHAVGKINNARTGSILNGWCSWFYTLSQVSEGEVMRNTEFAAKHLKSFGLEYIQIDEGFQRWHGDWEGNERFPHGMKWLADQIKSHGFKAGLWIAPYVISEPTEVFQKHPEWLLKNPDGTPMRVGNWPEEAEPPADENPKRYGLDITHPGAAQWLHNLVDIIANDWGYEMIKIDFIAWTILAAKKYYNPTMSAAEVYHNGMEIMRKAAGPDCHILECGPGATTVGLIDSMRIELDAYYGYSEAAWETYFLHPACSASAAAKRFYYHKRTWVNDVDHVCIDLLNNQQSEAAATIIGMSGGNMFSGDRLTQLDPYKLEILQKITPAFGEAARAVDLFDAGMQSVFALKVKKSFGEWTVAAFFNESLVEPVIKQFALERLWIEPGKIYLVYDFWKKEFLGEISGDITVTVQPGSVTLVSIHEKTGRPQFISSDRHVMQGAVELEELQWNENTKTISGVSTGASGSSYNLYVYVPGDHPWTWGGYILFRDFDSYSLKLVHKNIIEVHLRFEKGGRVNWEINTEDFFK